MEEETMIRGISLEMGPKMRRLVTTVTLDKLDIGQLSF